MGWTENDYSLASNLNLKNIERELSGLVNEFADILKQRYELIEFVRGEKKGRCFKVSDDEFIYPAYMYGGTKNAFHNLVIIYSNSIDNMVKNDEEDGGQFFPEDFESKEAMFEAMLKEIEG